MGDFSIDSKPKSRAVSARARRNKTQPPPADVSPPGEPTDEEVNIRIKDRAAEEVGNKKSRIGALFKDTPIKGLLKDGAAETLKRPLTGIFRRPGSKAGRKREEEEEAPPPAPKAPMPPAQAEYPRAPSPISRVDYSSLMLKNEHADDMFSDKFHSEYPHLAKLDGIDMSSLTRYLCDYEDIIDETIPWTCDYLFTSITTELRDDWEGEKKKIMSDMHI